ncbi:hypothetical protein EG327_006576 [Venturia inaequalis]|uniref:Peptidase A1 domain-containing protein n=1 Tax=Venturia inaequalis TaxID=5025 RepID=A0A8H3Z5E9_VENIN|nr:hypothetical protein EG327_006576 [Venturia inaequalis]
MTRLLLLSALATLLASFVSAKPEVLSMPIRRDASKHHKALLKRRLMKRDPFSVNLDGYLNQGGFYLVNVTVGTPAQNIILDIDTGSSDIWMFGPNSCDEKTAICYGGTFNIQNSNSAVQNSRSPPFEIQYGTPGSGVNGTYFQDVFSLGGQNVRNLTMAVATRSEYVGTGIMGIGFALGEALQGELNQTYANLPVVLANQSLIPSASYSLYLDDLDIGEGTVLFGGYDTDKFEGNLAVLDIQPAEKNLISRMLVVWSSIGVTDKSGSTVIPSSAVPQSALLDSGTALTVVPSDVFKTLVSYFGANYRRSLGIYEVNCDLGYGTLDFGFGDSNGPVIGVPFSELAIPVTDSDGNFITYSDGSPVCMLGLDTADASLGVILGDTFLRSAYVVYDLDRKQIGIAQTRFNVTTSNVKVINRGSGNLAGASSIVASGTTLSYGATAAATMEQAPGAGAGTRTASGRAGGTKSVATASGTINGGVKTTYANRATDIPGATGSVSGTGSAISTKKSAAGGSFEAFDVKLQGFLLAALMFVGAGGLLLRV